MSKNCPFCPPELDLESWGMGPEGWELARKRHDDEHTCKCLECGQPIHTKFIEQR